ncbi:MAG TPA: hypothetical protein VEI82_13050 [Myxococcota bacterium]|nr:hypothetical protein [Myxococcota bacterium]
MPGKRIAFGLVAVLCVLGLFWLWIWLRGGEARGLRALPPDVRAALYQRTLANLREVCGKAPPSGLESFCERQAHLAVEFDECDAACFALARVEPPRPTR